MKRAVVIALLVTVSSCSFAVKHPAATSAAVGGTIALGTCELASAEHKSCFLAGGAAGAFLGLVVLGALWLGTTDEEPAPVDGDQTIKPIAMDKTFKKKLPVIAPPAPPVTPTPPTEIPEYLKSTTPHLQIRVGGNLVKAPDADQAVAASYAASAIRGPLVNGHRITILTAKTRYKVGEEVRVIHVLDVPEPGQWVYMMGPAPIYGEYVDGVERTPKPPAVSTIDGSTVESPAVNFNFEITTYKFDAPGPHRIQWRDGGRESNVLELMVDAETK